MPMYHYYILHKPYEMLSQFTGGDAGLRMLGDLGYDFPEGIHAVGRLDYHSEGLLILTTNPKVTKLLFEGPVKHKRTYLVQAYKAVADLTLKQLRTGVLLKIKGGLDYVTTPCEVLTLTRPILLPIATHELPPSISQTWLEMTLTEGKYRQIRKMLKAVHHPCRRLMRTSIEDLELGDLDSGSIKELTEKDFFQRLHIGNYRQS